MYKYIYTIYFTSYILLSVTERTKQDFYNSYKKENEENVDKCVLRRHTGVQIAHIYNTYTIIRIIDHLALSKNELHEHISRISRNLNTLIREIRAGNAIYNYLCQTQLTLRSEIHYIRYSPLIGAPSNRK